MSVAKDFISALRATQKKTKPADDDAVVRRIEGNTAWVHIPGGVDETPVQMTINCEIGETVKVRRADGRAWIVGNGTAPPTDDKRAIRAEIKAIEASRTASDYITDTQNGVFVHPADDATSGWRIADAIELLRNGVSYIWAGLANGLATVRVGRLDSGHTNIDSNGMRVYGGDGTKQLANIGYGESEGEEETVVDPYFTFGQRQSSFEKGSYSFTAGLQNIASAHCSVAEGRQTRSFGMFSHAQNYGSLAMKRSQTVIGEWNERDTDTTCSNPNLPPECGRYAFIIGCGTSMLPKNAFTVQWDGTVDAAGGYTVGGNPLIQSGQTNTITASANSYVDTQITFGTAFGSAPNVVVGFMSTSTAPKFGLCSCAVHSVTATGFTVRVFNADTVDRTPRVYYIATAQ